MSKRSFFLSLSKTLAGKGFFFVFCVFSFFFAALSLAVYWTNSEIYPVHTAQHLFSPRGGDFLFSLKPVYNLLLFLSFHLSEALSLFPMTGARFLFALNGLCLSLMMYFFLRKKTDSYTAALAVLTLVSCQPFLERGFRVRSDLLCSSLAMLSLILALKAPSLKAPSWLKGLKQKSPRRLGRLFSIWKPAPGLGKTACAAAPLALALLTTPKGVYWLIFMICFLGYEMKGRKLFPRKAILQLALGAGLAFFLVSLVFHDPFFLKAIQESGKFYAKNIQGSLFIFREKGFLALWSQLSHLSLFAEKAPHIVFLILLKTLFAVSSIFIKKTRKWNLSDTAFFLLLAFLFLHPQQKMFFICALIPFFLIFFFTDPVWREWRSEGYRPSFRAILLLLALAYTALASGYALNRAFKRNRNISQKIFIKNLNQFFAENFQARIYDPMALLYRRKDARNWFIDSHSSQELIFLSHLQDRNIDIVIPSFFMPLSRLIKWEEKNFKFIEAQNQIYYRAWLKDLKSKEALCGKDLIEGLKSAISLPPNSRFWYVFLNSSKLSISLPPEKTNQEKADQEKTDQEKISRIARRDLARCAPHARRAGNLEETLEKNIEKNIEKKSRERAGKKIKILAPRQLYTEEEFSKGLIRPPGDTAAFAGLLYLPPPPKDLLETSPRSLFSYDLWF